jgi:ribonuclease J
MIKKANPNNLLIYTIGGFDAVGRNMTAFEYKGKIIIVDCGLMFSSFEHPGIDAILPDYTFLKERKDDILALIITHGHEDHIGAIPYFVKDFPKVPVVGSNLTCAFIDSKIKRARVKKYYSHVIRDGKTEKFGPFDVKFIPVTHSIPDSFALHITTDGGNVFHTGDFKLEQKPIDGRITDLKSFADAKNIDILMSDSTNAEISGFVKSESEILPTMIQKINDTKGLVLIASFASNVHRIQQALWAAKKTNRKVALFGKSFKTNMKIARELGYLTVPENVLISEEEAAKLPKNQLLLIVTGTQGEPLAVLTRVAKKTHEKIKLDKNDAVIMASSKIPGNEEVINYVINNIAKTGATIYHNQNSMVHVSGHANMGELEYVLNIIRPKIFMPVHGSFRQLKAHENIANKIGIKEIFIPHNGYVLEFDSNAKRLKHIDTLDQKEIFVDGNSIGEITKEILETRKILGEEGFISAFACVCIRKKEILVPPTVITKGNPSVKNNMIKQVEQELLRELTNCIKKGIVDEYKLSQKLRRVLGVWVSRRLKREPMLLPVVKIVK